MSDQASSASKFTIFRAADAKAIQETDYLTVGEFTPIQIEGFRGLHQPDLVKGDETKVIFAIPGFSLINAWFKRNYPLPLHSHDADCLYYIVAGSLKLGTEELGPRDGFFIPSGVPYTYTPGPEGVEVLEFRQQTHFDIQVLAKGQAFWKRAVETATRESGDWKSAKRPTVNT